MTTLMILPHHQSVLFALKLLVSTPPFRFNPSYTQFPYITKAVHDNSSFSTKMPTQDSKQLQLPDGIVSRRQNRSKEKIAR